MSGSGEEIAARYLEHLTVDALDRIAQRIRDHVAGGLSDPDGFLERKQARESAEYAMYKSLVTDRHLRLVIVNGIVMRRLESNPANRSRIDSIKNWLKGKWNPTSVRQAEFVQRGMLLRAIQTLEHTGAARASIGAQIETLLSRVEEHTVFVEQGADPRKLGESIKVRVLRTTPNTFIVFGKGYARPVAKRGVRLALERLPENYSKLVEESNFDYVAFIGEKEEGADRPRITWWTSAHRPG